MRPSQVEGELASLGRIVLGAVLAVLAIALVLVGLAHHHAAGGPVQLTRAQYCGPAPSYYPGVKHGARPAGC